MGERWLPVSDYEGVYEVSDAGRVRSMSREAVLSDGRHRMVVGRVLKPTITANGRREVSLSLRGTQRVVQPSRLVAKAFVPGESLGREVCHKDGDPTNDVAENLYWGTRQENMLDKRRHGTDHNANKVECPRGHPYSGENLYVNPANGGRNCRKCVQASRERYERKRMNKSKTIIDSQKPQAAAE